MKHYNPSINKSMSDTFNLKGESTSEIFDQIIPILSIRPRVNIIKGAAAGTIYTTPVGKKFFLQSVSIAIENTAADAGTNSYVQAYVDGIQQSILFCDIAPSTANAANVAISFQMPILIDPNTAIAFTAGNIGHARAVITGYTEEVV